MALRLDLLDRLEKEIRNGCTLTDLRHMVGPTKEQSDAAKDRIAQMDLLWPAGKNWADLPWHTQERYTSISSIQKRL